MTATMSKDLIVGGININTELKAGVKTSEFWLVLAADVAATVLLLTHRIDITSWKQITGGASSLYILARTGVKAVASGKAIPLTATLDVPAASEQAPPVPVTTLDPTPTPAEVPPVAPAVGTGNPLLGEPPLPG